MKTSEIEDLLRETLVGVAKAELEWDIAASAAKHTDKPIVDIFTREVPGFSKYKLAKAFLRWSRDRSVDDLTANEIMQFENLFEAVNKVLT
ncbi:hypothetical protein U8C40_38775 (plasmid) [Sinorhizobium medicae]|uniref:hypothetical protein n=1 Tax=Sinorhizobium TaxID=28105 RepID=UPI001F2D59BF|nr:MULTISPECIES: hypothetical protein [Sinorhizobium]WQO48621.1 hypothetical protein U8C42_27785 [Sinorhizobium medicae]WQO70720.1 hypothetical protein U8C40_38775 [Sinorhizobium medicae]